MTTLAILLALLSQSPERAWTCAFPRFAPPSARLPALGRALPRPPSLRPGDSRTMWLQNMSVMPPVQVQASLTCRGQGSHCYVMVEDSAWNAGLVDSSDVARIIERFERSSPRDSTRGVWQHNTENLGIPPDAIDGDSLIYLVYYNIGTFMGYSFDGFWQYFDEYYDTTSVRLWGYHSNEVECVYLDCYPNNPAEDYRVGIAAHEFGHMIHWNYDPAESLWVNEGTCELAMWLFGTPDDISGFNTAPDNDLTRWNGDWADYIKTYLWFLYLYEQYGGRIGTDLIHSVVAAPEVSIAGIDSAFARTGLPERFEPVLDNWVLANIIADTTFADGRYGYYGDVVPRFSYSAYHSTYPVTRTTTLSRWAGEYVAFQRGPGLELGFDDQSLAGFRLYVVGRNTLDTTFFVDTIPLDSVGHGSASVPGADTLWQWVYLVPVNHSPYGVAAYSYSATAVGIAEPEAGIGPAPRPAGPTLIRMRDLGQRDLFTPAGRRASAVRPGVYWQREPGRLRKVLLLP